MGLAVKAPVLRDAFGVMDGDGDGYVDFSELKAALDGGAPPAEAMVPAPRSRSPSQPSPPLAAMVAAEDEQWEDAVSQWEDGDGNTESAADRPWAVHRKYDDYGRRYKPSSYAEIHARKKASTTKAPHPKRREAGEGVYEQEVWMPQVEELPPRQQRSRTGSSERMSLVAERLQQLREGDDVDGPVEPCADGTVGQPLAQAHQGIVEHMSAGGSMAQKLRGLARQRHR